MDLSTLVKKWKNTLKSNLLNRLLIGTKLMIKEDIKKRIMKLGNVPEKILVRIHRLKNHLTHGTDFL
jgi:hypothetical protein